MYHSFPILNVINLGIIGVLPQWEFSTYIIISSLKVFFFLQHSYILWFFELSRMCGHIICTFLLSISHVNNLLGVCFWDSFSLWNLGCPGIHYVDRLASNSEIPPLHHQSECCCHAQYFFTHTSLFSIFFLCLRLCPGYFIKE